MRYASRAAKEESGMYSNFASALPVNTWLGTPEPRIILK
jgi:hypothetical protein